MRKILIMLILVVTIALVGCSNYPDTYPELNLIYDGASFETKVNGATWINGNNGGSSAGLAYWDMEVAKDIKPIPVES